MAGIINNRYFIAAASLAIYICLLAAQRGPPPEKTTVADIAEYPEKFIGRTVIVSGTIYYQNESEPTEGYYMEDGGKRINVCAATKLKEKTCTPNNCENIFERTYTKIDIVKSEIGKPVLINGRILEIDDENGRRYELCWPEHTWN